MVPVDVEELDWLQPVLRESSFSSSFASSSSFSSSSIFSSSSYLYCC